MYFSGKKPSPRSRGMSTISQFVKMRPLKQFSELLTEQFQPLSTQMRSASLLLLLMFIYVAVTCLATVSWWGKFFLNIPISFSIHLYFADIKAILAY